MAGKANFFSFQDAGESENDAFAFAGFVGQEETTEEALNIDMNFRVQNIPQTVEMEKTKLQATTHKQQLLTDEIPKHSFNRSPSTTNNNTNNNNNLNNSIHSPSPITEQNSSNRTPSSVQKPENIKQSTMQMLKPITMKRDLTSLKPFKIQHKLNTSFQPIKIQRKIGSLTAQNGLQKSSLMQIQSAQKTLVQNEPTSSAQVISFNKRTPLEEKPCEAVEKVVKISNNSDSDNRNKSTLYLETCSDKTIEEKMTKDLGNEELISTEPEEDTVKSIEEMAKEIECNKELLESNEAKQIEKDLSKVNRRPNESKKGDKDPYTSFYIKSTELKRELKQMHSELISLSTSLSITRCSLYLLWNPSLDTKLVSLDEKLEMIKKKAAEKTHILSVSSPSTHNTNSETNFAENDGVVKAEQ